MRPSNHTLLMNMVIGLCKKTPGWPSILKDLGYDVDWIEPRLINSEGKRVVPDLMLTSNRLLHSLIVECKGGKTLDMDQFNRLTKLDVNSIVDRASVYDVSKLKMDICFTSFEEHLEDIVKIVKDTFPILVFSNNNLNKEGAFKLEDLNRVLSDGISLEGKAPPTSYIPFTDEDDISIIAMYVLQELVAKALKSSKDDVLEFDAEKLLNSIFPVWSKFDEGAKKRLRNKVNKVIREIILKKLHGKYLEKLKDSPIWVAKTLDPFREECEKLLRYLETQWKLDQFD